MCCCSGIFLYFTFCSNLSISIFVRSLQECFGLLIAQVSPVCSEMLENKPAQRKQSESNTFQKYCVLTFTLRVSITNLTGYMLSVCSVEMMYSYLSSSSSMKPLLSASRIWKAFFTSSADFAFSPTISKNLLGSNESTATKRSQKQRESLTFCLETRRSLHENAHFFIFSSPSCHFKPLWFSYVEHKMWIFSWYNESK